VSGASSPTMLGHHSMQRGDPGHAFGQPPTGRPVALTVLHLDVAMGLGPLITDEQPRDRYLSSSTSPETRVRHREEELPTR